MDFIAEESKIDPKGLPQLQAAVHHWITSVGVRYFSQLTNMCILMEEVGELSRIMSRLHGEQSFKPGEEANLADEMADVLFVLLCLANQNEIDLQAALEKNLKKKTERDATRHSSNPKLS